MNRYSLSGALALGFLMVQSARAQAPAGSASPAAQQSAPAEEQPPPTGKSAPNQAGAQTPPAKPDAPAPPGAGDPRFTVEPVMPPEEAVKQAVAAFERIDQGGDLQKEAAEITRLYKLATGSANSDPWLSYIRGRSAILSGRMVDGIEELEAFSKTAPGQTHWKTFRILGDLHLKDYPRLAEAKYKLALALNDREPTILLGLSQAKYKLGQRTDAIEMAERAVQMDAGKSVTYLDTLAAMLRIEGQSDKEQLKRALSVVNQAMQIVQTALKEHPADPSLLQVLAAEYESALVVLRDMLTASPDNASAYADVAMISENLGEVRRQLLMHEAIALIEQQALPRLQGKVPATLAMNYGRLLEQVGRIDSARSVYEQTLIGEPDHVDAKAALERLNKQYPPEPGSRAEGTQAGDKPPPPPATAPKSPGK